MAKKRKKQRKKLTAKEKVFTVITWFFLLWFINFLCGFVAKNRYIAVDPISKKTAPTSLGYFEPNQDKIILFPGLEPYRVKINAMGLRSVGIDDSLMMGDLKDHYKVLAIGDSVTFGLYVDDEDSYPYRLQQIFKNEKKNAVVLNAGIGEGTVHDYIYYLKIRGFDMKPDVIAVNFCSNDLGELLREKPLHQRFIDENVFDIEREVKLANFMRMFRNVDLSYRWKRRTNKIKDDRVRNALFDNSKDIEDIIYVSGHQGGPTITDPESSELDEYWDRYFDKLEEFIRLVQERNIDLVFIMHPDIVHVYGRAKKDYQDILIPFLRRHKVKYVDLRPQFKKNKQRYLELYNNPPRDFHLGGFGNQILAEEVYKRIRSKI